jgi:purine-binding chemotaxis protein CheW
MSGSDQKQGAAGLTAQYVVFAIEGEEYSFEILQVQEIIRMTPPTWLPRRPDYVIGVINLRGEIIPVVDLRRKFGLPPRDYTRFTRILIGQIGPRLCGMVVDGVNEVIHVAPEQIETPPALGARGKKSEFIRGIIKLDINRILSDEEALSIDDVSLNPPEQDGRSSGS